MSDLVKRLRIKAGWIEMGEMIVWGSVSTLMREAADALEMAAPDVQGEPVGYVRPHHLEMLRSGKVCGITMEDRPDERNGVTVPLFAAQPAAEQQAAPDVAVLVKALERIANMGSMSYHPLDSAKLTARNALDVLEAHRKQQEKSNDNQ